MAGLPSSAMSGGSVVRTSSPSRSTRTWLTCAGTSFCRRQSPWRRSTTGHGGAAPGTPAYRTSSRSSDFGHWASGTLARLRRARRSNRRRRRLRTRQSSRRRRRPKELSRSRIWRPRRWSRMWPRKSRVLGSSPLRVLRELWRVRFPHPLICVLGSSRPGPRKRGPRLQRPCGSLSRHLGDPPVGGWLDLVANGTVATAVSGRCGVHSRLTRLPGDGQFQCCDRAGDPWRIRRVQA
mmetsp:Transcript_84315/g.243743  ORF Transcript_84315/g.243743 Transcript_84315/m.243743 type:complete len:236 (-) Transcript_84315:33-740(-)